MTEEREIKSVIPSYYSFIMTGLTELREIWAVKRYVDALYYALNLSTFLPTKLKQQIEEDKGRIKKQLKSIESTRENGYDKALEKTQWKTRKIAIDELEPFIDKMIQLLDSENLLTQQYGIPTRKRELKNIGDALS
jgi:hypothetical protein